LKWEPSNPKHPRYGQTRNLNDENVFKVVDHMSCEEILQRDLYMEGETEHHELKEIIEELLALTD
jgi:hypothetical protein